MTSTEAVTKLINLTVDAVLAVDPMDLPLHGKFWTLRITDKSILLRIQAAKVNDTAQPRHPVKEPPANTPKPQPKSDPPKTQPPPDKGGQK